MSSLPLRTPLLARLAYSLRCQALRRSLGLLLAVALGCLLLALLWWAPLQRQQRELAGQLEARRTAAVRAERLRQALAAQQAVLPLIATLEGKLQRRATQADLVQGIARLARQRGLRVLAQTFEEGKPQPGGAQPLYLELGLAGDYAALRRFTGDLASLPMWIEIVEERLERTGRGEVPLQAHLRLLTYRQAPEVQP